MRFRVYLRSDDRIDIFGTYAPYSSLASPILKKPTLIHDSWEINPKNNLESPTLELTDSAAGSFVFKINKKHPAYSRGIHLLTDTIYVVRDDKIIWDGRPIKEEHDIYGTKTISCEGALAYFNDTLMLRTSMPLRASVYEFFTDYFLSQYNDKITPIYNNLEPYIRNDRLFYDVLSIIFDDQSTYYWNPNYESHMTWLKTYVLDNFQAHCKVVYPKDSFEMLLKGIPIPRYLCIHNNFDHDDVKPRITIKRIDFGSNMISYSYSRELNTSFMTSVVPRGETIDDTTYDTDGKAVRELANYVYISDIEGKRYLENSLSTTSQYYKDMINDQIRYGYIGNTLDFSSIKKPSTLKSFAKNKYKTIRRNPFKEVVQINGIDLKDPVYSGVSITSPNVDDSYYTLVEEHSSNGTDFGHIRIKKKDVVSKIEPSRYVLPTSITNLSGQDADYIYKIENHNGVWPMHVEYQYCDPLYFDIWTKVLCTSAPHNIKDKEWHIMGMSIPLDAPENTTYTLQNMQNKITDRYISYGANIGDVAGKFIPDSTNDT